MTSTLCYLGCATCLSSSFATCLTCSDSTAILRYGICVLQPSTPISIGLTCILPLLAIALLMRQRSVALTHAIDCLQLIGFLKFYAGYNPLRQIYLYAQMRSWPPWTEGWTLLSSTITPAVPIFSFEQDNLNKAVRIASIWVGLIIVGLLLAIAQIALSANSPSLSKWMSKNIKNICCIAFYLTSMDISFLVTSVSIKIGSNSLSFQNTYSIIQLTIACILATITLLMLWILTSLINRLGQSSLYYYENMLCHSYDFWRFPTYSYVSKDSASVALDIRPFLYSNSMLLIQIIKMAYASLACCWLNDGLQMTVVVYRTLGCVLVWLLIWWGTHPFNPSNEKPLIVLCLVAELSLIGLIVLPMIIAAVGVSSESTYKLVGLVLVCLIFLIAIIAVVLESCFDRFKLVPIDLYQIGLTINIEDAQLKQQLRKRDKELAVYKKKNQEMEEAEKQRQNTPISRRQSTRLSQRQQPLKRTTTDISSSIDKSLRAEPAQPGNKERLEEISQESLSEINDARKMFQIDPEKRRKVYQWDKKAKFVYSNQLDN